MDKLSQKRVKRKIIDQILDERGEMDSLINAKTWHASDDANFSDIIASLDYLDFKIVHKFAVDNEDSLDSVFLLCTTSQGHECMIIVPHIECKEAIVIEEESASLVPFEIKNTFMEALKGSKTAFAFLTHHGIDGVGNSSNYSYDDQEVALKSLKRGTKFYMPLPLVDYDTLISTVAANNVGTLVNQSSETTLYKDMLEKSGMSTLLDSNGPYTVFAPTNEAIHQSFEDGGQFLFNPDNHEALKAFVLNHIFVGSYDFHYTGEIVSMQGEKYDYDTILNASTNLVAFSKANGFVSLVDKILEPTKFEDVEVIAAPVESISDMDIAQTTYDIWLTQDSLDRKVRADLREQLTLISNAISLQEKASQTRMKELGQKIVELDDTFQDVVYETQVSTNQGTSFTIVDNVNNEGFSRLDQAKFDLAEKNDEYGEYMKSSARLAALKYLLSVAAKIGRDI